jgi:hypothetical protein
MNDVTNEPPSPAPRCQHYMAECGTSLPIVEYAGCREVMLAIERQLLPHSDELSASTNVQAACAMKGAHYQSAPSRKVLLSQISIAGLPVAVASAFLAASRTARATPARYGSSPGSSK